MPRIEKSVFISYRRTNVPWALNVYQDLTHHGYDVFFDFEGIGSGDFESIIVDNITSRAHFLILLTPSALERCNDPRDWLRREIEVALETKRNIVPLMLEGFSFSTPSIATQLTGKLAALKAYNGVTIPVDYFPAAMEKLRSRFLDIPLVAVMQPATPVAQRAAKKQNVMANARPPVQDKELTAQQYLERGIASSDPDEQIRFFTQAIRLNPDYSYAYSNRGVSRAAKGELDTAIRDYNEAIRLKPDYVEAYNNRAISRQAKGDLDGAIRDCNEAIRLKPDYANAYFNRGASRAAKGDLDVAIRDYNAGICLKPDSALAYHLRGELLQEIGQPAAAITDLKQYLKLGCGESNGDTEFVQALIRDLQKEL